MSRMSYNLSPCFLPCNDVEAGNLGEEAIDIMAIGVFYCIAGNIGGQNIWQLAFKMYKCSM